jgi:Carboxypeptidase regulatory-like domain/TonB dependent receptor-like, beta-barrel
MFRSKLIGLTAMMALLALVSSVEPASAQAVYGSILGTITDPQGASVKGAKVTVTSQSKGTSEETTSNDDGNYSATHLIPGLYSLRVEASGFKIAEQKNVIVSVDAGARVDLQLQVGGSAETVEVTSEAPQLVTDRSDVASNFSERTVESLPVYGRNFTSFQLLSPGNAYQTGFQHAASENPQGSAQILTQGQHFSGTAFELDGTDNQDPILGIIVINPNLDAIQEVKITSQNYDAEFGKAIGAVVTTQTKSGTNEFHGSVFDYERSNSNFARNPFTETNGVASGNWNEFGATLGGPIVKNKLFIFGDYQGTRSHVGSSGQDRVPTATERTGDLSDLGINIYDPYQTSDPAHCNLVLTGGQPTPVSQNSRAQFPGNVIPACRLSAPALALLNQIPLPNTTGATILDNNFTGSGSNVLDSDGFDIRSDYTASTRLTGFGRYSLQKFTRSGPGLFGGALGGPNLPSDLGGFAGISSFKNQSVASGFNYVFGSSLLTDFRFGYLRYSGNVSPNGVGSTPATDAGAPGLNLGDTFTSGMPYFHVFSPGSPDFRFGYALDVNQCNCPLSESEHQYQFVNNWTKIRGNHSFKFGADIRYAYNLRVPSDRHRAGELEFNNDLTRGELAGSPDGGSGIASYLLGYVTRFQRFVSSSTNAYETQKRLYFYGQDTWRVTNKLTLNYGLRWELYIPESVKGTGLGGWVDTLTGEMRVAGENGVNLQGNTDTSYKHLAPRVGIAYQLDPKTVIRMGYGRSYDLGVFGTTFGHIVTQNLPVLAAQDYSGGSPAAQDINTAFFLSNGPVSFDPALGLTQGNCNQITDPTGLETQCVGPNGRPRIPDGVSRDIRNFKNTIPSVDAWNLSVQRQLTPSISLTASYVGNKSTHTTPGDGADYNLNGRTNVGYVPGCDDDPATGAPNAVCIANNGLTPKQRTPFYGSSAAYPYQPAPFPNGLGGNFGWTGGDRNQAADQNAKYNALQVVVSKRFSQGLSFTGSYTFQHAVEQAFATVGFARYQNIDPGVTYGPNESYRDHEFILTQVYELPFGKGKRWASSGGTAANALVGGWSVNSATTFSSGLGWTPGLNSCAASIDQGPCIADVTGSVKDGPRSGDRRAPGYWFGTTNGVALNALGATAGPWGQTATLDGFGNAGINQFRGPKFFNANASLFKSFSLGERVRAQFEFKFYNLFNHVNLDRPNRCVDCSNGGQITALTPGAQMRRLEYGAKVVF